MANTQFFTANAVNLGYFCQAIERTGENIPRDSNLTPDQNATLAVVFSSEIVESFGSLARIAELHGIQTLVDLMYFQNAIFMDWYIEAEAMQSAILDVIENLTSKQMWLTYIARCSQ